MAIGINSSDITVEDATRAIVSTCYSPIGRNVTWNWFRKNYDAIKHYFGDDMFLGHVAGSILESVSADFNTVLKLEEFESFYQDHIEDLENNRQVAMTQKRTKANVVWMDNNYETVMNWFERVNEFTTPAPTTMSSTEKTTTSSTENPLTEKTTTSSTENPFSNTSRSSLDPILTLILIFILFH